MNTKRGTPWVILGYVMGAAMIVVGTLVVLGFFRLRLDGAGGGAVMLRTVFGVVLALYGIYRVVITASTQQRARRDETMDR